MDQLSEILWGPTLRLSTDFMDSTIIQQAVKEKRLDVVQWLINQELVYISDNTTSDKKFTLLYFQDNILETLEHLNRRNYSITTVNLMYANMHRAIFKPDVLYWLLQHGGNVEELYPGCYTLLHRAIKCNLFDVFYLVLECGAEINAEDLDGNTALHHAVESERKEMAHWLIRSGCNINAQNAAGQTPLHLAVKATNQMELFKLILPKCKKELLNLTFFYAYLRRSSLPTDEWINYLYLLLRSKFGKNLLSLMKEEYLLWNPVGAFYISLIRAFDERKVRREDRTKILKMLLERKIPIYLNELCNIYLCNGMVGEFLLLLKMPCNICAINHRTVEILYNCMVSKPMVMLILYFDTFANDQWKCLLNKYIHLEFKALDDMDYQCENWEKRIMSVTRFFSLRQHVLKLNNFEGATNIINIINKTSIVPSLIELSRNKVRGAIGQKFPKKEPSFYRRYVKQLEVPRIIADIIALQVPIYYD